MAAPSMEVLRHTMVPVAQEVTAVEDVQIRRLISEVRVVGGNSGKQSKAFTMTDADAACYTSRYSDMGGKNAKDHFRLHGDQEGRLPTCARELSDYESETYLHTFPELQQKFGDGLSAIKQARNHYMTTGYS